MAGVNTTEWTQSQISNFACSAAGYFSSRAAAKGFIRGATSYLQAARQLEVVHCCSWSFGIHT